MEQDKREFDRRGVGPRLYLALRRLGKERPHNQTKDVQGERDVNLGTIGRELRNPGHILRGLAAGSGVAAGITALLAATRICNA
ncbi:hypothetical protein HYS94_01055 [Candidatus Daviesbacteria bacterium]|nr:hypothetical protein [Candidatus Daviesbacteria bacterium]